MTDNIEQHQQYVNRALDLAIKGEGMVEPNPLVGAVLVKNNKIISEGYHEYFGGPHAEIISIDNAKEPVDGATLYVNLEPCAHFGKTPPCVETIIKSNIRKVVVSVRDPNPLTDGKGIAALKKAGIEIIEGISENRAREINAPFFKLHQEGLPYFVAKWAMSLDGKIATKTGDSKWISSEESRMFLHGLREKFGGIMVGINTVIVDNPALLGRQGGTHNPRRIILDSFARLPVDSEIVKTVSQAETYLIVAPSAPQAKVEQLYEKGIKIIEIEEISGKLNLIKLARKLGETGINKIIMEGGSRLLASAFESELIDEFLVFLAPKIIGGEKALSPLGGMGIDFIRDARIADFREPELIGNDILIRGKFKRR